VHIAGRGPELTTSVAKDGTWIIANLSARVTYQVYLSFDKDHQDWTSEPEARTVARGSPVATFKVRKADAVDFVLKTQDVNAHPIPGVKITIARQFSGESRRRRLIRKASRGGVKRGVHYRITAAEGYEWEEKPASYSAGTKNKEYTLNPKTTSLNALSTSTRVSS